MRYSRLLAFVLGVGILLSPFGAFFAQTHAATITELQAQITTKETRIRQLQEQVQKARKEISGLQSQERTLAGEIARFNREIASLNLEITITEDSIESTTLTIEKTNLEIDAQEEEIAGNRTRLMLLLRNMAQEQDRTGVVAAIFSGTTFSEMFDALQAEQRLQSAVVGLLRELAAQKQALEEKRAEAQTEETRLEKFREELTIKRYVTSQEQEERDGLLKETKNKELNYKTLVTSLEAEQKKIDRDIIQLESQLRRLVNPASLPGKGVLAWPVEVVRITQYYGATSSTGFVNDQYDFHNGIDLAPPGGIGTPILAAASGTVLAVGSTGRYAYGKWVAIDHHNALVTLYAHLSVQAVTPGQEVAVGQVIGYEGSTGFSTGPHLHFTVYASETFHTEQKSYGLLPYGGSLNPLDYLE